MWFGQERHQPYFVYLREHSSMLIYWLRSVCSNSSQVIIVITYFKSLTKITPTGTEQVLTLDSPPYSWVRMCVYARGFSHANSAVMRSAPVKQRDTVWSPVRHFWGFLPDIFILTSSRLVKLFNIGLGLAPVFMYQPLKRCCLKMFLLQLLIFVYAFLVLL